MREEMQTERAIARDNRGSIIRKPAFWAILFLALALSGAGVTLLSSRSAEVAVISIDGEIYDSIDLSAVAVPYERTIRTEWGWNTIRVSHGAIEVVDADCPGHDCVRQGSVSDSAIPIVCLPHKLVIEIRSSDE